MSLPSWMWLFPVIFILHDFEEILLFEKWVQQNRMDLHLRFPRLAPRLLSQYEGLKTPGFALAVLEEFLLLVIMTLISVERGLPALWMGFMMAYCLHLLVHGLQALALRRYIPGLASSILTAVYCLAAFRTLASYRHLAWQNILGWSAAAVILIIPNLLLALWLGRKFQHWLENQSRI